MIAREFVFFSKKRWQKIKIISLLAVLLTGLFAYTAFLGLTQSSFSEMFAEDRINSIVDSISTKDPGKIQITGTGPILNLENKVDGYQLNRTNPLKADEKVVILTFDDGPDPHYTPAILEI